MVYEILMTEPAKAARQLCAKLCGRLGDKIADKAARSAKPYLLSHMPAVSL
jgi:hypothetical protein